MKPAESQKNIVIIGAGATACALAIPLARAGRKVILFQGLSPPPLVVGESLVPAVIPHLQALGVEEAIRPFSLLKPGAVFRVNDQLQFAFKFDEAPPDVPPYAYNVPRHEFDEVFRARAREAGAVFIPHSVDLVADPVQDTVRLDPASINAAHPHLEDQPDLMVDATGRARLFAKLLRIPARRGDRKDCALFAHVDRVDLHHPQYVHTDRLTRGWSWRIPLPDRVSMGLVVPEPYADTFGATPEEQFDRLLQEEPFLASVSQQTRRISGVQKYDNYQAISTRAYGGNWVMLGDAAGFVDPVFSSGLLISLESAQRLAEALIRGEGDFESYQAAVFRHVQAWQQIVDGFYSGRLFTSFKVGMEFEKTAPGRWISPYIKRQMSRIFTGCAATRRSSLGLLNFLLRYGLRGEDPAALAIG